MEQKILDWLLSEGLSESVIKEAELEWNGQEIVIPVFDRCHNFLFNKYRRNPFSKNESVPKYRYDFGSQAVLFNAHTIKDKKNEVIFLTEGEKDALVLNSLGMNAVSSTGGAGTFRPEWFLDLQYNDVYIVFDKDDVGIKGALRVNALHPDAKIIFFPENFKGKDICDYFKRHTVIDFQKLIFDSYSWTISKEPENPPKNKTEAKEWIQKYNAELDSLLIRQRDNIASLKSIRHIELLMEELNGRINGLKRYKFEKPKQYGDEVSRAKAVPITNYVKFDRGGFATCLFHSEKTGSMRYYAEKNKIYCFACNAHKDVIDIVMKIHGVEFQEALNIILGK